MHLSNKDLIVFDSIQYYKRGDSIYSYTKWILNKEYRFPIINSLKTQEVLLDTVRFDVLKFAANMNISIDSALNYVKYTGAKIQEVDKIIDVNWLQFKPSLGGFIIFHMRSGEKYIYLKDQSSVVHPYWKEFFSRNDEVQPGWYIYMCNNGS